MSASFRRLATVVASTRRPPAVADGKRGEAVTHLTELRCTPLDPADAAMRGQLVEREVVKAGAKILQTMCESDLDIREGDILIVNGREYPIRSMGDWAWRGGDYKQLFVEELQKRGH